MALEIRKAVKYEHKLRLGLGGPTGAGKTYTMLRIGTRLAELAGGRLGVIDTEHGTASLYADTFDFDVIELESFAPDRYIEAIRAFEASPDHVVIAIDSLSHAWIGKDGELEQVDRLAAKNQGNTFVAWRHVTPQHNDLVEALVGCKKHLIATMRSKMAYELQEDAKTGKKKVEKLGMAPVMRDGIEYEFDLYAEIDIDHTLEITKTRCHLVDGYRVQKAGEDLATTLFHWAKGGAPASERPAPPPPPTQLTWEQQLDGLGEPNGQIGKKFVEFLSERTLTTRMLAEVAPGDKPGTVNPGKWLKAHPDKTLRDLVQAVIDNEQRKADEARGATQQEVSPPSPAGADSAAPPPAQLDDCTAQGLEHDFSYDADGALICMRCSTDVSDWNDEPPAEETEADAGQAAQPSLTGV